MDLSLLRSFVAVYRAGSLSAAAPQLGLSQPTVTAQVKALEAQLGQQLFERRPRGVAPTSVADELARQVAEHIDALNTVVERGITPQHALAQPVHLAGPSELMSTLVVPSLVALVPGGLTLRATFGLADDLLAGLAGGRFDLVVSTIRPRVRGVSATPFYDEEFVLVAAPSWAEQLTDTPPAAMSQHAPLIAYAEDLPIIRRYWRTAFGTPPRGTATIVVPDLRTVLAAVIAGAGISVLPRYLCTEELSAGSIVPLHEPDIPPINTLYLATRTGTATRPHIHTVQTHLLQALRTAP